MLLSDAKAVARRWVAEEAADSPRFRGALFHGSSTWLPEDAVLPATSDLDLMVVLAGPAPPEKPGKFRCRDVLLDVSHLASDQIQSSDLILGRYHLAGSFQAPSIISDPSGHLAAVQSAVGKDFAQRRWVRRRCEDARDNVLRHLQSADGSAPLHDQVTAWLFGAGVTTHVLLTAGLRNPTVRRRYEAARELLTDYGRPEFHETLLAQLGSARMSQARVERHLTVVAAAFDAAGSVVRTPFFFASDIGAAARPIAIDGSRESIARGSHREAVFWIAATYSRCQKVLAADGPEAMQAAFDPGYRRLLDDLGIVSPADLRRRVAQVQASLPDVWEVAEAIMAANRGIEDP